MPEATCALPDCPRPPRARGWCEMHYRRWQAHGDPLGGGRRVDGSLQERLLARTLIDPTGCWTWTGPVTSQSYGLIGVGRSSGQVHRVAYTAFVEPLPRTVDVDHVCHSLDRSCPGGPACWHRRCWRLDHLEAVDHATNVRRGVWNLDRTGWCMSGRHDTTVPGGVKTWSDGRRMCFACWRETEDRRVR